jgi:hypothetical protein
VQVAGSAVQASCGSLAAGTLAQWPIDPERLQARHPVHDEAGVSQQTPSTQSPEAHWLVPVHVIPSAAVGVHTCALHQQPSAPQLPTAAQSPSTLHCPQPLPSGLQCGVSPPQRTPHAPQLPSSPRLTQRPLQHSGTPPAAPLAQSLAAAHRDPPASLEDSPSSQPIANIDASAATRIGVRDRRAISAISEPAIGLADCRPGR